MDILLVYNSISKYHIYMKIISVADGELICEMFGSPTMLFIQMTFFINIPSINKKLFQNICFIRNSNRNLEENI